MSGNQDLMDRISTDLAAAESAVKRALLAVLETLARDVSALESSVLTRHSDDELRFYLSTNSALLHADIKSVPLNDSIAGIAMLTGQALAVDEPKFSEIDEQTGTITKAYVATPIVAGSEVVGVLTLVNRVEGDEPFDQTEIQSATRSATLCGYLLSHAKRLQEQTRSTLEGLQGLLNAPVDGVPDCDDFMSLYPSTRSPDAFRPEIITLINRLEENDMELVLQLLQRLADNEPIQALDR